MPLVSRSIPREGYLPGADSLRLFYRVIGSGSDTVVAVHGGPGAGMNAFFVHLAPLGDQHTVIFYDQRGGGRSELPADTTLLDARYFVEDLEAVRRFFGLEQMKIIAHSFGPVLVARYAQRYPERVERMIFLGASAPERAAGAALFRQQHYVEPDSALQARMLEPVRALVSGSAKDPIAACRAYEAAATEIARARGEASRWRGTTCAPPAEAVAYYYHFTARITPDSFGNWDFTDSLGNVKAPLLVIAGDLSSEANRLQRAWAAAVPHGRVLLVPNAGKAAISERPEVVYPAIESFLSGQWPVAAERPEEQSQ
ncbi:MAG: alpha/beta fold hydrolase [Gemmatimonadetes bacterium]|nr:alpha/beta fold hydrolase [Gemmatimonadota bacterium]